MWLRLLLLLVFCISAPCFAEDPFPVSELRFAEDLRPAAKLHMPRIFAGRAGGGSMYCLLGNGFILAPSSGEENTLIIDWLKNHKNATVVPVSEMSLDIKRKTKMVYAWIEDGPDNLNEYLIRAGAFPGGVMADPVDFFADMPETLAKGSDKPRRLISDKDYHAFLERIAAAEAEARAAKKGVWSSAFDSLRGEEQEQARSAPAQPAVPPATPCLSAKDRPCTKSDTAAAATAR